MRRFFKDIPFILKDINSYFTYRGRLKRLKTNLKLGTTDEAAKMVVKSKQVWDPGFVSYCETF